MLHLFDSCQPVLECQTFHSFKFTYVVCYQSQRTGNSLSCNQHIVGAYGPRWSLQNRPMAVAAIIAAKVPSRPAMWSAKPSFEPVLTGDLWTIITSCLEKDPGRRPTADDLAARCSTLAYFTGQRYFGRIHRYPAGQGQFGFISAEGGDIFFHRDSFYSSARPAPGMPVTFASFPGRPCDRAFPVVPVNEED